jgi:hypothetical protein
MQLLLARHPNQLDAEHPIIIENLLEFSENQQQSAIDSIIEMLSDLHQFGQGSRYLKKMKGNLVWELKTRSRGGQKGGARVYLFFYTPEAETSAVVVNAEIKDDDEPSEAKLIEVLEVALAFKNNPKSMKERSA